MTDRTPLLHALFGENVVTFKYLLDHGANQDKVNTHGFAPLHSAAGFGTSMNTLCTCTLVLFSTWSFLFVIHYAVILFSY